MVLGQRDLVERRVSSPFRSAAVERYHAGRGAAVLLSLGLPPVAPVALALLALFGALVAFAAVARIPVYVPGVAVVVQGRPGDTSGVYAALLLPADSLSRLQPGQPAYLDLGQDGARLRSETVALEPDVISPDGLASRLSMGELGRRAMFILSGPVAVAYAPLDQAAAGDYLGGVIQVNVETGSRPVLALVPPFDRLAED
jgi:hypothetical protein